MQVIYYIIYKIYKKRRRLIRQRLENHLTLKSAYAHGEVRYNVAHKVGTYVSLAYQKYYVIRLVLFKYGFVEIIAPQNAGVRPDL